MTPCTLCKTEPVLSRSPRGGIIIGCPMCLGRNKVGPTTHSDAESLWDARQRRLALPKGGNRWKEAKARMARWNENYTPTQGELQQVLKALRILYREITGREYEEEIRRRVV